MQNYISSTKYFDHVKFMLREIWSKYLSVMSIVHYEFNTHLPPRYSIFWKFFLFCLNCSDKKWNYELVLKSVYFFSFASSLTTLFSFSAKKMPKKFLADWANPRPQSPAALSGRYQQGHYFLSSFPYLNWQLAMLAA